MLLLVVRDRAGVRRAPDRRRVPDPARPRRAGARWPRVRLARPAADPARARLVFLLFLPPILFGSGYSTPIRDFKANARPIGLLAIGLVLFTTVVVGVVVSWLDPGAGGAPRRSRSGRSSRRRTRSPRRPSSAGSACRRRVVTILEGESLINDASALIAYRVAIAAAVARRLLARSRPACRSSSSGSAGSWSGSSSAGW